MVNSHSEKNNKREAVAVLTELVSTFLWLQKQCVLKMPHDRLSLSGTPPFLLPS